jgi:hypothetical protein
MDDFWNHAAEEANSTLMLHITNHKQDNTCCGVADDADDGGAAVAGGAEEVGGGAAVAGAAFMTFCSCISTCMKSMAPQMRTRNDQSPLREYTWQATRLEPEERTRCRYARNIQEGQSHS